MKLEILTTLIKKLDDDLRELLDKRYDLQFEIDNINDIINEKKMLRTYYKLQTTGDIDELSKAKIEVLTRTKSQSPKYRSTVYATKKLKYGQK